MKTTTERTLRKRQRFETPAVRLTIRLEEWIWKELKSITVRDNTTMELLINNALGQFLPMAMNPEDLDKLIKRMADSVRKKMKAVK